VQLPIGDDPLQPGEVVTVHCLVSKPELNGKIAVVVADEAAPGSACVLLEGAEKPMSLKIANISPGMPVGTRCIPREGSGFKAPDDCNRPATVVKKLQLGCH